MQTIESSYIKLYDLYNRCIASIKNGTTLDSHLAEEIANLEQALDGYFEELNMLLDSWGLEDMQTILVMLIQICVVDTIINNFKGLGKENAWGFKN